MTPNYKDEVDRLLSMVPPEHFVHFLEFFMRGELTPELSKAAIAHPQLLTAVDQGLALLRKQ